MSTTDQTPTPQAQARHGVAAKRTPTGQQARPGPVTFRDVAVEKEIALRATRLSHGQVASRDLGRYYAAITADLTAMRFSMDEALLLFEVIKDWEPSLDAVRYLWSRVYEHQMDSAQRADLELPERLRKLGVGQIVAIIDACERASALMERDPKMAVELALSRSGLLPLSMVDLARGIAAKNQAAERERRQRK